MLRTAAGTSPTGAEALVEAMSDCGVDTLFANPGTTEMPIVSALDSTQRLRAVLGLHENVCTGAADGYGRISGRPAATLLHLGPGLANGLANLHNARRAHTPIVNVVGDHASWHLAYDAPLTSDIAALAATVGTVRTCASPDLADDVRLAVGDAVERSGVATLIVPADHQQRRATVPASFSAPVASTPTASAPTASAPDPRVVERIAALLRQHGPRAVLLLGGSGLTRAGQLAAGEVAARTGAALFSETFPARVERGGGLPAIDRLPYFPERAIAALEDRHVILIGSDDPVAYFGYEGIPSRLAPPERAHRLAGPTDDAQGAVLALAGALGSAGARLPCARASERPDGESRLDGQVVGATLASLLPEGAIVSVEGGTCGYPFFSASHGANAHTSLTNTGGAIGQGLPVALGASIAAPDRPVVALQSDGSGLYTVQALWSMARENCDAVVLIAANHKYDVLRTELARHDHEELGVQASALTGLGDPNIDWRDLAAGFGLPATVSATAGELAAQFTDALSNGGPHLIEMVL
ncbi:acetolactate synthase large subunit [Nocardioides hungaricus]